VGLKRTFDIRISSQYGYEVAQVICPEREYQNESRQENHATRDGTQESLSMMKFKTSSIPFLCLVLALTLFYTRQFIPHNLSSPDGVSLSQAEADVITLHYHERAPYYMTGPLGVYGLCADPVKRAFEHAGIPFRWEKTPAKRQLDILRANTAKDCLIGWFKNPQREKIAKYTHAIYRDKPTIALARADNPKIVSGRSIEETLVRENLILLRKTGYSYGPFIDAKISHLNPRQEMTSAENVGMLRMIHSGRADYFFISEEEATALTATSGLLATDFSYIRFTNIPKGNHRYLLFSRQVEDAVIEKLNLSIDAVCK